uniref:Uncharacterized protein n=1 Tax=Arundo donax TaxID=35708 RepID=A0A0A8YNU0_ARUDO
MTHNILPSNDINTYNSVTQDNADICLLQDMETSVLRSSYWGDTRHTSILVTGYFD